jgi:hypothetical protein
MSSDAHDGPVWEALEREARERARMSQASPEGEPGSGDLYVLPETADLPVEWAVLDAHLHHPHLWRAVPADTNPLVGSEDVEVPADAPGGPLSLRCRFPVWLEETILTPERRAGRLSSEHVHEALHKRRQIETGDISASALAREVDVDPEYRDWIGEVVSRAPGLAPGVLPSAPVVPIRPQPRWRPAAALAAVLGGAVIGLSFWVLLLRRDIDRLSGPILEMNAEQLVLGSEMRSPLQLSLSGNREHLVLVLVLDRTIPETAGRLEMVDRDGKTVWRSTGFDTAPGEELHLVLPRRLLRPGTYRIRLLSGSARLAESVIEVQ